MYREYAWLLVDLALQLSAVNQISLTCTGSKHDEGSDLLLREMTMTNKKYVCVNVILALALYLTKHFEVYL